MEASHTSIKYAVTFYSYWHCGSGLSAGASADALVVRDKNGLPFIPGKTIKGLLREVVEDFSNLSSKQVEQLFGTRVDEKKEKYIVGQCHFANATLAEVEQTAIVSNNWKNHLCRTIASTAIDEQTGTAKDSSLRTIEVTVPCTLYGEITGIPQDAVEEIKNSLRLIKRLGAHRNRGLGRCDITIVEPKKHHENTEI